MYVVEHRTLHCPLTVYAGTAPHARTRPIRTVWKSDRFTWTQISRGIWGVCVCVWISTRCLWIKRWKTARVKCGFYSSHQSVELQCSTRQKEHGRSSLAEGQRSLGGEISEVQGWVNSSEVSEEGRLSRAPMSETHTLCCVALRWLFIFISFFFPDSVMFSHWCLISSEPRPPFSFRKDRKSTMVCRMSSSAILRAPLGG